MPLSRSAATLTGADELEALERSTLLGQIYTRHCLLELRPVAHEGAYQSAIIENVPDKDYFVIDALTPAEGNSMIGAGSRIALRCHLDGVEITFDATVTGRGGDAEAPYYKVRYPDVVNYPQRRREHRAPVPLDRGVTVEFSDADGRTFSGELKDLSPSGFSARLDASARDMGEQSVPLSLRGPCTITFGDNDTIDAIIELCHVEPAAERVPARVGACFVDLDAPTERKLERYVARLERERARLR